MIYPRVVGNSIGLPGLWVLAAVTVGGGVLGVCLHTLAHDEIGKRLVHCAQHIEELFLLLRFQVDFLPGVWDEVRAWGIANADQLPAIQQMLEQMDLDWADSLTHRGAFPFAAVSGRLP